MQRVSKDKNDPSVIPLTIKALYGIGTSGQSNLGATQAIAEMQHALGPEGFAVGDLNMYQKSMGLMHSIVPKYIVGHNDGTSWRVHLGHGPYWRSCRKRGR